MYINHKCHAQVITGVLCDMACTQQQVYAGMIYQAHTAFQMN